MNSEVQRAGLSRRQILKGSAGLLGAVALPGVLSACSADGGAAGSSSGPIRIAVTSATSGALAIYGRSVLDMIPFAVDYLNGQAGGGRKIEFKTYSNNGETADVIRAVESAVNQDGFKILTGYFSSAQSAAIQQSLDRLGLIFIDPDAQADGLTGKTCHPMYFRTVPSVSMNLNTLAEGVRGLGIKSWSALCSDYAFGHDAYDAFATLAKSEPGVTVKPGHFPPLTHADYGSYITQLLDEGTTGLFTGVAGADAITFFNQASRFGLIKHFDAIVGVNSFDVLTFKGIGKAGVGLYGVPGYDPGLDNQRNKGFVEAFTKKFGREPYYIEANTFVALETLQAAVSAADSTEPEAVATKMSGSTPDTIMGKIEIRKEDHQIQRENWFGRIVSEPSSASGGLAWEIAETVDRKAVSTPVSADCKI
jgi:branched-chain amino acid transport system substrate-binding protein